jgi:hypothetical protein
MTLGFARPEPLRSSARRASSKCPYPAHSTVRGAMPTTTHSSTVDTVIEAPAAFARGREHPGRPCVTSRQLDNPTRLGHPGPARTRPPRFRRSSPAADVNARSRTGPVRQQRFVPAQRRRTRLTGFVDCLTVPSSPRASKALADPENRCLPGLLCGADDGTRTRDPHLGKVMLYQLSHVRVGASD